MHIKPFKNMFHDIANILIFSTMISTLYHVHHTLISFTMISTLYRGKNTRIIKVNPFHDDTTMDEKYQFTCSVVFSATEPSWKGLISVTE
jgi:hypothetical protein